VAKHGSESLKGYSKMAIVPSDRTIVLHLLRGAVPERADDLSRLWREHGHDVEVAPSAHGSTMNATSKRIKFDTKTIDFFWLLGFSVAARHRISIQVVRASERR
jgi:hypothetical protein